MKQLFAVIKSLNGVSDFCVAHVCPKCNDHDRTRVCIAILITHQLYHVY